MADKMVWSIFVFRLPIPTIIVLDKQLNDFKIRTRHLWSLKCLVRYKYIYHFLA